MARSDLGRNTAQGPGVHAAADADSAARLPEEMTGKASPAKAAVGDQPVFAYIASLATATRHR